MISEHISYEEATKSQTAIRRGIDNTPTEEHLEAMKLVAEKCFEPIRKHFGIPIGISSFYRSKALNKAIGGAATSQHTKGEAIDIDADIFGSDISNKMIFDYAKTNLSFDQLIHEYGNNLQPAWVHISYKANGNRNQVFYVGLP